MVDTSGIFSAFQGINVGFIATIKWIFYLLPFIAVGWLLLYMYRHPHPVRIIDLRQRVMGEALSEKEYSDKGGVYYYKGVPYLHLMKRFRVKYLRVPLGHEISSDGKIHILRLGEKSYRYAPRKIMLRKEKVEFNADNIEHENTNNNQIMLGANPEYNPRKPKGNPNNAPFLEIKEGNEVKEFGEGEVRHYVEESHTDAFSENVKAISERVYATKDWRPVAIFLGGFAMLGIMFIFLLIFAGRI